MKVKVVTTEVNLLAETNLFIEYSTPHVSSRFIYLKNLIITPNSYPNI